MHTTCLCMVCTVIGANYVIVNMGVLHTCSFVHPGNFIVQEFTSFFLLFCVEIMI